MGTKLSPKDEAAKRKRMEAQKKKVRANRAGDKIVADELAKRKKEARRKRARSNAVEVKGSGTKRAFPTTGSIISGMKKRNKKTGKI